MRAVADPALMLSETDEQNFSPSPPRSVVPPRYDLAHNAVEGLFRREYALRLADGCVTRRGLAGTEVTLHTAFRGPRVGE
jgi:hypothetical protein